MIALAQGGGGSIIPLLTKASFLPASTRLIRVVIIALDIPPPAHRRPVISATSMSRNCPVAGTRRRHSPAYSTADGISSVRLRCRPAWSWTWWISPTPCPTKSRGTQLWEFTKSAGTSWRMTLPYPVHAQGGCVDAEPWPSGNSTTAPSRSPPFQFRWQEALPPSALANASGWSSAWRLAKQSCSAADSPCGVYFAANAHHAFTHSAWDG